LHDAPQTPQLVLVFSWVSQPFEVTPSQLPQPAVHEAIWQAPVLQADVALASAQATPQVPQLASVFVAVSQPFKSTPSQLPQSGLHEAIWQNP
jgi:hypothetical protein